MSIPPELKNSEISISFSLIEQELILSITHILSKYNFVFSGHFSKHAPPY